MKKSKKQSGYARFAALSDAAREKEWAELNDPAVASTFKPLTGGARKEWNRAKRKPGRPKVGAGSRRVQITMEQRLLGRADQFAREKGMTRSELIARSLEMALAG